MSEAAKEAEPKKKKGKLPIIIVLVVVLAGGGFFMKSKASKGPPKPPPVELGTIESLGTEFLTNLADGRSYVLAEVSVHVKKGFDGKGLTAVEPALRSAVVMRLRGFRTNQVQSPAQLVRLRRMIAWDLNQVLEQVDPHKADHAEEPPAEESGKKHKKKKHEEEEEPEMTAEEWADLPDDEREHPDWDHDEGPVLKVYFGKFATQ